MFAGSAFGGLCALTITWVITPVFLVLLATMGAYFAWRKWKPDSPPHHKRFILAAVVLPYLAAVALPTARRYMLYPRNYGNFEYIGFATPGWAVLCGITYGCYRLIMRAQDPLRGKIVRWIFWGMALFLLVNEVISHSIFIYFANFWPK